MKARRVTPQQLLELARGAGVEVERDEEIGLMFARINGHEIYAAIEPDEVAS